MLPLRYFDDVEQWHSDPTLFPSAENNEGRFLLQRLGSRISRSTRPSPPNPTARRPRANATTHTARELADWTAAAARDDDDALDSLTQITGLSLNWVHRRLNNADGRVRLRNAFARRWPNDEDTEAEGVAVTHGYTADTLASMTVASARDNRYVIRALARITHITETGVRKRLGSADGRARLGTLFEHFWPE